MWTCNDDYIDVWDCTGKVRVAAHQLALRLGKACVEELIPATSPPSSSSSSSSSKPATLPVSEAIALMLRHIGIESCRLAPGFEFTMVVVHSLPLSFLRQCCDLLEAGVAEGAWSNVQAVVVTLQAVLPSFLSTGREKEEEEGEGGGVGGERAGLRERVRSLVWDLLINPECTKPLLTETRRIIRLAGAVLVYGGVC